MSDDVQRVRVINETDLEGSLDAPHQLSARNDPGMRDGDNSHGAPSSESGPISEQDDSDTDVGDTSGTALAEEFGVLDAVPANETMHQPPPEVGDEEGVPEAEHFRRPDREARQPRGPGQRAEDRTSPQDRDLPLEGYQSLTIPQIFEKIPTLSDEEIRAIRDYEKSHRRRKTLLVKLERRLRPTEGPNRSSDRSRQQ